MKDLDINDIYFAKGILPPNTDFIRVIIRHSSGKTYFNFGGKHESFEYHCSEFIKFLRKMVKSKKLTKNHFRLSPSLKEFLQTIEGTHPLRYLKPLL